MESWICAAPSLAAELEVEAGVRAIQANSQKCHEQVAELCAKALRHSMLLQAQLQAAARHIMELECRLALCEMDQASSNASCSHSPSEAVAAGNGCTRQS